MIQSQKKTPLRMSELKTLFTQISKAQFDKKYQGQQYFASGVQSQVFKAIYQGNPVAIKYYRKQYFKPQFITYIQSELESLKQIRHQNIVSLIGSYHIISKITQRQFCIVTEYCQNNLQSYELIKRLTDVQKLRMCEQILSGIKVAHEKGFVHRDIKPENILIKDTKSMTVKIADFGCSKQMSDHLMTNLGSPMYSDLNITLGGYSNKCDIYSAGLVIIYIFCGKHFFTHCSKDQLELCKEQLSNHIQQSTHEFLENYDLTPQIKDFIETVAFFTLSNNQDQRYNATDLLQLVQNERINFEKQNLYKNQLSLTQEDHNMMVEQQNEKHPSKKNYNHSMNNEKQQTGQVISNNFKKVEKGIQKEWDSKSNSMDLHKPQLLTGSKISKQKQSKLAHNDKLYESFPVWEDDSTTAFEIEQVSLIEQLNRSNLNYEQPDRYQQGVQQQISQLLISRNSFLSKDSEQPNSNKSINEKRLNRRGINSSNLSLSGVSQTFKSRSQIDPGQRIQRLQENSKNLTDTQKLCSQIIKYQAQCVTINQECEAVKVTLMKFINMKINFVTIKKIEQIQMSSLTIIQKKCISYFYHYLYIGKLEHLINLLSKKQKNLESQFGKISSDSKKTIYEIVVQEIQRIFPNLKKYAIDLSKKANLIRPKLSQNFIYSISDIQCCEKSSQLQKINFQETLIKTEAIRFISEKLKEIKNQKDLILLTEIQQMLTQISL